MDSPTKKNDPDFTPAFDDNTVMPFGKHKGKKMANVPAVYLLWLYGEGCNHEGVKKYIVANLSLLEQEAAKVRR